ncbi:MAG TPA: serine/threonine-protein kinase [Candidatus Paceibacterota bacterium]|nr:serine/threonine-protein kinase [Verrucomicrobiota bacterium]HSA11635.1 serine/threonine-protein kinase [Candidatus Paceibacterota bacterium]
MSGSEQPSLAGRQRDSAESPPPIPGHFPLRPIARGSYGEIWLARTDLGAFRAVKIIRRANFTDSRPYDREFAGIQSYEPISREHAGLVDVLQVGRQEAAGFFHYVMELADDAAGDAGNPKPEARNAEAERAVAGPDNRQYAIGNWQSYVPLTLAQVIRQRERLPAREVIEIGIELAGALDFLHSRRLVHRDVKPSNIIFAGGQPKLADVGLIADLGNPQSFVGTEGYIPPEGPGTMQADIYSLGKVLYEAATGKDRQQFPDLPTRLGEGNDDPALPELNEVLLKACESNPRARYSSAAQMVADLQRLRDGESLRARRARRQRRRTFAIGTVLLTGLGLAAVGLVALIEYYRSQPRLWFRDDFGASQLDTNLWACGHKEDGKAGVGHPAFRIKQSGGELMVSAMADHEGGWTVEETAWVELKHDLRQKAPCRIEIELTGTVSGGRLAVGAFAGAVPSSERGLPDVAFAVVDALGPRETNTWPARRLRIDLLAKGQAAVIYPDADNLEVFEVADLGALPRWRLRILAHARTARGLNGATADLRIRQVVAYTNTRDNVLAGRVVEEPSEWPIADAVIKDARGQMLAKVRDNGAFVVPLALAAGHLTAEKPGYVSSSFHSSGGTPSRAFMTVALKKGNPELGDVVDVIKYGPLDVQSIGFRSNTLTALVLESDTNWWLVPVDVEARRVPTPGIGALKLEFPEWMLLSDFAECGNRMIAIKRWQGGIVDLDVKPPKLLLELRSPSDTNSLLSFPCGAAFDGRSLWFAENDGTNERFHVHELDLARLVIARSLRTVDRGISGIAWDGTNFWISSARQGLYQIDPSAALGLGTLEMGVGRRFPGLYHRLAYGQGYLWGLDPAKRRICRIQITD